MQPKHSVRSVKIVKMIEVISTRGDGENTPFREVVQHWTLEGRLLQEYDPCPDKDSADGVKGDDGGKINR